MLCSIALLTVRLPRRCVALSAAAAAVEFSVSEVSRR